MKLRLQRNSVRLRLTRSEVERLRKNGAVEESVHFGERALTYRLEGVPQPDPVRARFADGAVIITVAREAADAWCASDEVGIYADAAGLLVSIEKDFRCLTRPLDERERDAYPHPGRWAEA